MAYRPLPRFLGLPPSYQRLVLVAENHKHWKDIDKITDILIEHGHYSPETDRRQAAIRIRAEIALLGQIRGIFNKNNDLPG